MNRLTLRFAEIVLAALTLGGCSIGCHNADAPPPNPQATIPIEADGLHIVDNTRLRRVMHDLQELNLEQWERRVELGNMPTGELRTIASVSGLLAKDARVIPLTFEGEVMSAEQRSQFTVLARRLEDQAKALERAAEDRDALRIQSSLASMINTCNRCHNAFRGPLLAGARGWNTSRG